MNTTQPKTQKPTAMYVHGLGSGAYSHTFRDLSLRFPQYIWGMSEYSEDLAANVKKIEQLAAKIQPSLIVASSMGALALLFAKVPEHTVKVLHNPALSLADSVRNTIGLGKHNYFCRRLDHKIEFELTEQMCCDYENFLATHEPQLSRENYAIFSEHDELLGDAATAAARNYVENFGFKVFTDAESGHRITPKSYEIIATEILAE